MTQKTKLFFIFFLFFSLKLMAVTELVVALPCRHNMPLDPHWYTPEYVDYIAKLLPKDQYHVTGYFVSMENIPTFLDDIQKLHEEKGNVCVLNICDGGEWDGYPCISVCRLWEQHAIHGIIPKSGADATFILNSDDKFKMQTFLPNALPQTLVSSEQPLDITSIRQQIAHASLDSSWPLFCKLNVGAAALSIGEHSICQTIDQLMEQLQWLRKNYPKSDILVQPYLPGPEYTVLILGDTVYAAIQRNFHNGYNIMYEDYLTGQRPVDQEISYTAAPKRVQKIALEAIRAIPGKHHYTRVDMRDGSQGKTYVIDINDRPSFGDPSTVKDMLDFNHLS